MVNTETLEKKDTRSGFGIALHELGKQDPNVVAICADLTGSLKMDAFEKEFPERFFQAGVAEANMIGLAAGLAVGGKIPFTGTFANFSTGRVYDQIRQSVAYSEKNVKICASHAGLTLGEDGATHQMLEDLGMMKMLPNMTVVNPCDHNQTILATKAVHQWKGPVYLRFGRPKVVNFTSLNDDFTIGKGVQIREGNDLSIIATGHLVWEAIIAADQLESEGYSVDLINIHTIKPLDEEIILNSARKTGKVITAEEHQRAGGLGESVASLLSREHPTEMDMVAVMDTFGESGTPAELMAKYGIDSKAIIAKSLALLK